MRRNYKVEISVWLHNTYSYIGMDRPSNHSKILSFLIEDVEATADPKEWHEGDIGIAFRRYLEKDEEN